MFEKPTQFFENSEHLSHLLFQFEKIKNTRCSSNLLVCIDKAVYCPEPHESLVRYLSAFPVIKRTEVTLNILFIRSHLACIIFMTSKHFRFRNNYSIKNISRQSNWDKTGQSRFDPKMHKKNSLWIKRMSSISMDVI